MYKRLAIFFTFLLVSCFSAASHSSPLLSVASFKALDGWNNKQAIATRPALLNSCKKLSPTTFDSSPIPLGSYQEWQTLCKQLADEKGDNLKKFFEDHFEVYQVGAAKKGLFTGYYSPVCEGRLQKTSDFNVPLLKYPTHAGKSSINSNDSRHIIEQKIQAGKVDADQVIVWLKNPVDKFFLQIQGSGNIQLRDGSILHAAYAGNNNKGYVSIGKILKEQGALNKVSMQTIRNWLAANPDKQQALFNKNPRYIFFRKATAGAITAQGIPA
ncbi:MltA domain-containing protein, partial [Endozoicomonas sp.]|nr:MltA domain-containing protein [Endozoicomonas sp.]